MKIAIKIPINHKGLRQIKVCRRAYGSYTLYRRNIWGYWIMMPIQEYTDVISHFQYTGKLIVSMMNDIHAREWGAWFKEEENARMIARLWIEYKRDIKKGFKKGALS